VKPATPERSQLLLTREIKDKHNCLRSLFRVLKAGGVALFHEHLPDPHMIRLMELKELAERAGFEYVRSWGPRWNYTALLGNRQNSRHG
jgi:ubiquinone/menaquinone biosynthesis C-methylase UbiE